MSTNFKTPALSQKEKVLSELLALIVARAEQLDKSSRPRGSLAKSVVRWAERQVAGKTYLEKSNQAQDKRTQSMTSKSMKIRLEHMKEIKPITPSQEKVFDYYEKGYNLCLSGAAGSGKTFLALALGLEDVLDKTSGYDKVVIIRSIVPTREIGFLPGNEEEKKDAYTGPYRGMLSELFDDSDAWNKLIHQKAVEFWSTSFIRGLTINNAIVIIDEMQNLNFHELDSVATRIGQNCKFIMCGDYYQSDFDREKDKNGILQFLEIIESMKYFEHVQFGWEDIVRSGFVREYIMTKELMKING